MDESIPELSEAREVLRRVAVPTGARERVLRGLRSRTLERRKWVVRFGVAGAGMLVGVAAAALGLGLGVRPSVPSLPALPSAAESAPAARALVPPAPPIASVGDRGPQRPRVPTTAPAPSRGEAAEPSELSQQVRAYQAAVELIPTKPAEALGALRAFRSRWPGSALGQEADLRIVQTLLGLGRTEDARQAARAFVVRYPESPRAPDMRAVGTAQ
jgi:TolA-binding protein